MNESFGQLLNRIAAKHLQGKTAAYIVELEAVAADANKVVEVNEVKQIKGGSELAIALKGLEKC